MTVRSIHQPGHQDATTAQFDRAVKQVTAEADVVGWSDAGGREVSPPGWGQSRTSDGCKVAWDKSVWKKLEEGVYEIPVPEYRRGHNLHPTVDVVWVLLEDKFGATILRGVAHLPSHVQAGRGYTTDAKRQPWVRAHKAALAGLPEMLWTLQREQQPDEWVLSADWNVDLRLKAWRDRVHAAVEPTDLRLVVPPRATFAKRKIDAHLTTLHAVDNETLPQFGGFDHNGQFVELTTRTARHKENR